MNETEPQNTQEIKGKISHTAYTVSKYRAMVEIYGAKKIAKVANAELVHEEFNKEAIVDTKLQERMKIGFEARYKGINKVLLETDIKNIFEFACGISPRGIDITRDPQKTYLGTDLADMVANDERVMHAVLDDLGETRPNLFYAPADALEPGQIKTAVDNQYKTGPIAIVSEGLFTYLDDDKRKMISNSILEVLNDKGGCWITTDLLGSKVFRNENQKPGEKSAWSQRNDVNPKPMFSSTDELIEYYNNLGFDVEITAQSAVYDDLSSLNDLDDDKKESYKQKLDESYVVKISKIVEEE